MPKHWFQKRSVKRDIDELLYQAVLDDDPEYVRRLMQGGASPIAVNADGYSSLEMAQFLGRRACYQVMRPMLEVSVKFQGKNDNVVRKCTEQEFRAATSIVYLRTLEFENIKVFRRVLRQCPWLLRRSALGRQHRWYAALYRQELLRAHVADVSIRWIDDAIGYGIFAEQTIGPNAYIGEYTGVVRQWNWLRPNHNAYCFHYPTGFWHFRIFMIDALQKGNITRFINHSDTPNAEPVALLDRGLLHIFFQTVRRIKPGEQITIDYGRDYWLRRSKFKVV